MSAWVSGALAVASIASGAYAANKRASAAKKAAGQQEDMYRAGLSEQEAKLYDIQQLLTPYADAGKKALEGQQNLIGLGTPEAQQKAIQNIAQGPQFQAMQQQGENSLLQNASATGGLRGGNIEAALAQFRPSLLSSLIQQQFSQLGGLSGQGLQASNSLGAFTQNTGNQKTNLFGQIGGAQAGASLAQGAANAAPWQMTSDLAGQYSGMVAGNYFKNNGSNFNRPQYGGQLDSFERTYGPNASPEG